MSYETIEFAISEGADAFVEPLATVLGSLAFDAVCFVNELFVVRIVQDRIFFLLRCGRIILSGFGV